MNGLHLIEEWRTIDCIDGFYDVSNFGRVRSVSRIVVRSNSRKHTIVSKILKPAKDKNGYLRVGLSLNGKLITKKVHRLVAEAFLGKSNLTVDHIDGRKSNNHINNLRYVTFMENLRKSFNDGSQKNFLNASKESNKKKRKLTTKDLEESKSMRRKGYSYQHIANLFCVNKKTMIQAIKGETYKNGTVSKNSETKGGYQSTRQQL